MRFSLSASAAWERFHSAISWLSTLSASVRLSERCTAQRIPVDGVKREAGDDDRDQTREQRDREVVGHRHGEAESQFADAVHRPDTGPHAKVPPISQKRSACRTLGAA